MILVTLGTQKFPFNRLLKKLDELIEKKIIDKNSLIVQSRFLDYVPKNYEVKESINSDEMERLLKKSAVVITHAGTGSIIKCAKNKKRTLIIPRKKEYGEHVDNHQEEIAKLFKEKYSAVVIEDLNDITQYLTNIKSLPILEAEFNNERLLNFIELQLNLIAKEKR